MTTIPSPIHRPARSGPRPLVRPARVLSGAAALALVAACSGGQSATPEDVTVPTSVAASVGDVLDALPLEVDLERNAADVEFVREQLQNRQEVVALAEQAAERAQNPDVTALAERVREEQQPQIDALRSWLETWDEEIPDVDAGSVASDAASALPDATVPAAGVELPDVEGLPGLDAAAQEAARALEEASGAAVDLTFLQALSAQYEEAVESARRQQAEGVNPQARELAETVENQYADQVAQVRQLLDAL